MRTLKNLRVKKIGVFRPLNLGDLICSIPAIRALKKFLPDSEIILIGLPWAKEFTKRYSQYFSGFISFPGFPGLPGEKSDPDSFASFLQQTSREKFDLIIQMYSNGCYINPVIELMGGKLTAGYFCENAYCPNEKFFIPYPDTIQEINRHLELVRFLGIQDCQAELEFPLGRADIRNYKIISESYGIKGKEYVCLHCEASDDKKYWSIRNFTEVAEYFTEKGFKLVLTGSDKDLKIAGEIEKKLSSKVINLLGKTDLGTLAALLQHAGMFFSNDTGVEQLASALKIPSVIVFLHSDPLRYSPLNKSIHEIILPEESENLDLIKAKVNKVLGKNFRKDSA